MPDDTMTTYRRADGEPLDGDLVEWSTSRDYLDWCEFEEPTEIVEEVWTLQSRRTFTLPTCSEHSCDEAAKFWGLCERHAREDDPEHFAEVKHGPAPIGDVLTSDDPDAVTCVACVKALAKREDTEEER